MAAILSGVAVTAAPVSRPLVGVWSGDRVTLMLTAHGGTLQEDCATTTLAGPVVRHAGDRFSVGGAREVATGGPQHVDEDGGHAPEVMLHGRMTTKGLALDVDVPGAARVTYMLLPGRNFKPVRCL